MSAKSKRIVKKSFERQDELQGQIFLKLPSLRLLAAFVHGKNYATIHKSLVASDSIPAMNKGRGSGVEAKQISRWEERWPLVKKEMDLRRITPRCWCGAYKIINGEGQADLFALIDPDNYEMDHGDSTGNIFDEFTVMKYLREDFPNAFPDRYVWYGCAEVLSELYYEHDIAHYNGQSVHILTNAELGIKAMNTTFCKAFKIFELRLKARIKIRRMEYFLEIGVTPKNISKALSWLPKDLSENRVAPGSKNTGEGYKMMQKAEQAANSTARA